MAAFDFSAFEGRERRDEALERVARAADPDWRCDAELALDYFIQRRKDFRSDDVWVELDLRGVPRPSEARALGPLIMARAKQGQIRKVAVVQGSDPKHHADLCNVWRPV